MKVTASLKNYGRPARKMRDLIALVKGLSAKEALSQLATVSRYGARDLEKLIKSAVANAKNNHNLKEESLVVVDLAIDGGAVLKRWMPRAYGNANRILKRSCHLEVVLEGEEAKAVKKSAKQEDKTKKQNKDAGKIEKAKEEVSEAGNKNGEEEKTGWQKEEKEGLKEEKKVKGGQNWSKKVFRRKSF